MKASKLHQLTNGNWVALNAITALRVGERTQCWKGGTIHPARLIIHAGRGVVEVCPCDDQEQADSMRDELAKLANLTRGGSASGDRHN